MTDTILKDTIKRIMIEGCEVLKISHIQINFQYFTNSINFEIKGNVNYLKIECCINIDIVLLKYYLINNMDLWRITKLKSKKDRLYFIVLHELSHYFNFLKQKKQYIKKAQLQQNLNVTDEALYRQLPLERTADKIALYILKTLKRK